MTFSEQIVYAMFKPSKYRELLELKKGRFAIFVVVLCLVLGIVTFAIPAGALVSGFGGFEKLFKEQMSDLSCENGVLKLEKPFRMDINGLTMLINTEDEAVSDEYLKHDGIYMAMGSRYMRMTITLDGQVTDYQKIDMTGVFPDGFNNDSLVDMIPVIYTYLVFMFLAQCVGFFVKYAVVALIYSLFINSVNRNMDLKLSYGKVFQICFYGQTLGIILSNFNAALQLIPTTIVSVIGIFISVHMITMSVVLMNPKNQV